MVDVTVIIPNWNGKDLLSSCLQALKNQTYDDYEIIVVDNGSSDGSIDYLKSHFPDVHLIINADNRGFAASTNQGIRAMSSRYVATLNNDVEVTRDWLAQLVTAMQQGNDVGMCASKMLFTHQPERINSAGVAIDRAGIAWDRLGGTLNGGEASVPDEVFGPCAGAALYRRAMLEEIGLFDENFFAYMEDLDLAWRGRRAGWRCLYVPKARVLHRHSATGKEGSPFKSFHLGRNKVWLLLKNYPWRALWYCVPLVIIYDLAALSYALLARRDLHALRGRLAALLQIRQIWRERSPRDLCHATDIALLELPVWPWQVIRRYRHLW